MSRVLKQVAGKEGGLILCTVFRTNLLECGGYQNIVRGRVKNKGKKDGSGFVTSGFSSKEISQHNWNL